jgi:hypothetical protein
MGYLLAGFTANEDKPLADYVADGVSIGHFPSFPLAPIGFSHVLCGCTEFSEPLPQHIPYTCSFCSLFGCMELRASSPTCTVGMLVCRNMPPSTRITYVGDRHRTEDYIVQRLAAEEVSRRLVGSYPDIFAASPFSCHVVTRAPQIPNGCTPIAWVVSGRRVPDVPDTTPIMDHFRDSGQGTKKPAVEPPPASPFGQSAFGASAAAPGSLFGVRRMHSSHCALRLESRFVVWACANRLLSTLAKCSCVVNASQERQS